MNSSSQVKAVLVPLIAALIFMLILLHAPASEGAISCGTVISTMRPCISYLQGTTGGKPPQPCCAGCQSLATATATAPDRKAACACLKNASQKININAQLAQGLPQNCGISLSFPISTTVDCTKIN